MTEQSTLQALNTGNQLCDGTPQQAISQIGPVIKKFCPNWDFKDVAFHKTSENNNEHPSSKKNLSNRTRISQVNFVELWVGWHPLSPP